MTSLAIFFWAVNLLCDTTGQLAFKASSLRAERSEDKSHWHALLTDGFLWLGVLAYVFEAFFWLAFLSLVPLSQGIMMGSVNIILVMLGGRLFFQEALTQRRLLAILLIAVGVSLVGWAGE